MGIKGRPPKNLSLKFDGGDIPGFNSNKRKLAFPLGLRLRKAYEPWISLRDSIKVDYLPNYCFFKGLTLILEHTCHLSGCEKVFTDASSYRKHMITHGER
jgi:hypothetical protein